MPVINDPRFDGGALAGPIDYERFTVPVVERKDSTLDVLAAAARQTTLAGAGYERLSTSNPDLPDAPPDWDPLDHVQGFEEYAADLGDARSPSELQGMKNRLKVRRQDMDVLERAGGKGFAASLLFGVVDPSFLASAFVPEVTMARNVMLAKTLTAVARGATGAAAYETGMQSLQTGRTALESVYTIGGGAILSGVLGNLLHRIPVSASTQLRNVINAEARSEVGAAAVARPTTLAEESIARGAAGMSKGMKNTPLVGTDLDVVMGSESVMARLAVQDLADVPQALGKNAHGVPTPARTVESAVVQHEARVADFIDLTAEQWKLYRARVPAGERMRKGDFYASIASASRRGDTIGIAEVDEAARFLRSRVFDPLKDDAQKFGLFAAQKEGREVGKVVGADSYFRRMYDRDVIRKNLSEWHQTLASHFLKNTKASPIEVAAAVEDVTRTIMHADVGQSNWSAMVNVPAAGPLKGRTLDIPDEAIEKFLINDPVRVARSYVRDLAPQVEMARKFGDVEMKDRLSQMADDYNIKRETVRQSDATDAAKNKALERLTEQEQATAQALVRIRDRVLNRSGRISPEAGEGVRRAVGAARGWRNLVAASKLGATAITGGLMDTAKIAAQYGFMPTISNLIRLTTSPAYRALTRAQARRAGSAVEVALSRRVQVAFDGALTEGWTSKLAHGVYKYTGLNHIVDFNRMLSATLLEDSVLKAAGRVGEGKAIGAFERTRLASLGLGDDELKAVSKEIAKHGGVVDGIRVSGSADWDDKALADIYDAAILKESKITVQQPGAADRVWWMDSETGKLIGQLKSFSLSAPTRLLSGGLQMAGQGEYGRAARFFGVMMMGGYLTHALRQTAAGFFITTDPETAAFEAFTESGLGGIFPDVFSPIGRRLGIFGSSVRYADRNALSAYGGPALGTVQDLYEVAFNRTAGGISASDLHAIRRLLPYQNVWYLRRAINALEGEASEALELEGATPQTFGERLAETKPLPGAAERGGTGTGQLTP